MFDTILLEQCSYYSDERVKGSNVLTSEFVSTDSMLPNKRGVINPVTFPNGNLISFNVGDILVGNIRPYLKKIWYSNIKGGCSPDVLVIRAKSNINSKFLYYTLLRDDFFNHMMNGAKGTKMPRGDKKQVMRFKIPHFDLTNQLKISSVLSTIDSKIEINNRINTELEAMSKIIFDYWFVQFDFPDKNGKPYKSSGGKMVWNEELKIEIPEGWESGSLLQIAQYENGLPCQKFSPNGNDVLRVIKIREMNEGFSANTEFVRSDIPKKAIIESGDVLFSWSASIDVKLWSGGIGALNQHIFKVTSVNYPKSFYYHQLINYLQHFKMMAENRKTTMGHITLEHLRQSRIIIPPQKLTLKLEAIIGSILSQKVGLEVENHKLIEIRDWLLPMLMNGQLKIYHD
jgi:type I restriction enzyme S subunit